MNKKYRLTKNYDIEKLIKVKKCVYNMYYVIYYGESETLKPMIALSVSKKLGNAITRNKQKRIIREIIRNNFELVCNCQYLIVEKKKALLLSYEEKKQQITYLLRKVIKQRRK